MKDKEELFYKVVAKGTKGPSCILKTNAEVIDLCGDEPEEYDVSEIKMTLDQYEHLNEFEGF